MAERYVKIFYDWTTTTKKLTYEEKGRLIDAIVCYASNQPFELVGNEDFIFPVFQAQIDRDKEKYNDVVQKRRVAGAMGGNQKSANASKCYDELANASKCKQEKEEDKDIKTKTEDKDRRQKIEDEEKEELHSYSAARSDDHATQQKEPAVFFLNLIDGTDYEVTQSEIDYYTKLYTGIDVPSEYRKMIGWIQANKKNRKTKAGIKRFINGWLAKAQDRSNTGGGYNNAGRFDAVNRYNYSTPAGSVTHYGKVLR